MEQSSLKRVQSTTLCSAETYHHDDDGLQVTCPIIREQQHRERETLDVSARPLLNEMKKKKRKKKTLFWLMFERHRLPVLYIFPSEPARHHIS